MCGIFGVVYGDHPGRDVDQALGLINRLFLLSETRGKEAAGLAFAKASDIALFKTPSTAKDMLKTRAYKKLANKACHQPLDGSDNALTFMGHSRLVTNGVRAIHANNQPVTTGGIVGVHNGIIVNDDELWKQNPELKHDSELDSEVIFALLRKHISAGESLRKATAHTFEQLEGAASIAALFEDADKLVLATNNGSLYYRQVETDLFVFASEAYILQCMAEEFSILAGAETKHVGPGCGVLVDMKSLVIDSFELATAKGSEACEREELRSITDRSEAISAKRVQVVKLQTIDAEALLEKFPYTSLRDKLRRCTRCVLPETMPYVDFDSDGVCSYCRNYPPIDFLGHEAIDEALASERKSDGRPDCIVGVSGGRDSIYGLHYVKHELGMNPVAYTYDWGMVTDLARRNISRICGKLGIEHILISADIPRKREFIRKNVSAWLAKPSLGTIPLFMAGDKAYFHYLNKARAQLGVDVSILCENPFERTDFKTGFAGVAPFHDKAHVYTLPLQGKIGLVRYYARQFLTNPRYLNASLADTARAFAFYYLIKRRFYNLYRYATWNEKVIESVILDDYGFERAEDTRSTWRIGDGTAAFYNYIYYTMAGMTENDTFRSNQIRNGAITRDEALAHIDIDNRPRFPSIQWYLDTIGLGRSIEDVLTVINAAPKLYA